MKFLVVGLGSMGKRRIRNLSHLSAGEVVGFDPREDRREEAASRYGVATFADVERAFDWGPDAVVVSTPPDLHMPYARIAAEQSIPFFCEASVVLDGMDDVIDLARARGVVGAPSCTMRYHPSVQTMKQLVDAGTIGAIAAMTYHSGQYLPDWHPWEDYRSFYAARRETGACREIVPFELTWLTWLLGDVATVACMKGKRTALDVDIDDVYQLLLGFRAGTLGHLLVDVVARAPFRVLRLVGEQGIIEWDASARSVRVLEAGTGEWVEHREPAAIVEDGYLAAENMYIEEMHAFVSAVRGEQPYPYTLEQDRDVLELLLRAEESALDAGAVLGVPSPGG